MDRAIKGIWIDFVCKKCGNKSQKKYFVKTLNDFNVFLGVSCSCGNSDADFFDVLDMQFSEGKLL